MTSTDSAVEAQRPIEIDHQAPRPRLAALTLWVPLAAAGAYLLVLFWRVPKVLSDLYQWLPDFVWAPILAKDLAQNGYGGLINVGEAAHYSSIWLLTLTEPLPFDRLVWEFSPLVVTLGGVLVMGWAARGVAGKWAGLMTVAIGISAGPAILATTITTGMRSHTWLAVGATAALLTYFAGRPEQPSRKVMAGTGAAAGMLAGATVASDPLYLVSGLLPFVGAATLGWLLVRTVRTRDLAVFAWATSLVAVAAGTALNALMHSVGFRKTLIADGYSFVTLDQFLGAFKGLLLDTLALTNGNFFGRPVGLSSVAALAMAVLTIGAFCLPFTMLRSTLGRNGENQQAPRTVYLLFWTLVLLGTAAAYLLSPIPSAVGQTITARYVVPIFYAMAAMAPVWAAGTGWRKIAVAGGTTVLCLLSIQGLWTTAESREPISQEAPQIAAFLQEEGLERGYGSYRLAHTFTYSVEMKYRAYPVFECRANSTDLCPFPVNSRSSWYRPESGTRTFLITDSGAGFLSLSSPPSERFGEPLLNRRFGNLTVFVYDYDIASRFVSQPA